MSDATTRFPFNPIQPGAYSVVDTSALVDAESAVGAPIVGILGDCAGGTPNTALYFTRPQAAKSVLRSGPLLDCVRAAFAGGAQRIAAVRVGNAIAPSTLALAGASGTVVTLTARDSGAWTNSIKATVAANNKVTIAYTDPSGVTYTETFNGGSSATAAQLAALINGTLAGGGSASAFVTAAAGGGTMPAATLAQTAMSGGADTGSIVSGDWTTGLAALETEQVDFVEVATGDATVHAQALAHCNAMSATAARMERVSTFGGVAGETPATVAARMTSLRDRRAQLVYPGISLFDPTGILVAYPPYVAASFTAGRHAGLPDQATSLTHADLDIVDVERRLSAIQGGDLDTLLAANVSPIAPKPGGGFWLVDSLSGYQADPSLRDFHKTRTADACARRLRTALEDAFVGGKSLNRTADSIKVEAISELGDQVTEELLRAVETVEVVQATGDPRSYLVTAGVMLPDTTKFIEITVALQPPTTAK